MNWLKEALECGINITEIMDNELILIMANAVDKFRSKEIYLPQMLISVKAMGKAMTHLRHSFQTR